MDDENGRWEKKKWTSQKFCIVKVYSKWYLYVSEVTIQLVFIISLAFEGCLRLGVSALTALADPGPWSLAREVSW